MKASNCKHETSNGRCGLKGCYAYRHKCFTEDLCKCHEPMTNADRIRAMSDEELAEFIISGTERNDFYIEGVDWLEKEELFNWLQQPCGGADNVD